MADTTVGISWYCPASRRLISTWAQVGATKLSATTIGSNSRVRLGWRVPHHSGYRRLRSG